MQQHVQTTIAGIQLDPDQILSAGAVTLMGIDDGDPLPHEPNVDTKSTQPPGGADTEPPEAA